VSLGWFGPSGRVAFQPVQPRGEVLDTEMVLRNLRVPRTELSAPISARYNAYLPTVVLSALVLSTPVSWRRRGRALLTGLFFVHVYILTWCLIIILFCFSRPEYAIRMFDLPALIGDGLGKLIEIVEQSVIALSFVAAIIIWLAVTIRGEDYQRLIAWARVSDTPGSSADVMAAGPRNAGGEFRSASSRRDRPTAKSPARRSR